jgi:hypothetical protein
MTTCGMTLSNRTGFKNSIIETIKNEISNKGAITCSGYSPEKKYQTTYSNILDLIALKGRNHFFSKMFRRKMRISFEMLNDGEQAKSSGPRNLWSTPFQG